MSTKPKLKLQFTEKMLQEYTVEKIKKQIMDMGLKGSVCNEQNYKALQFARAKLAAIKEQKLWLRHEKNNSERHRGNATVVNILKHLLEEVIEMDTAISKNDLAGAWEEIADVINCAEIIASCFPQEMP